MIFFVKKELYKQFGKFNLTLRSAADYELVLSFLYKENVYTHYVSKILVQMRVGGISNASFKNRWKIRTKHG